MTRGVQGRPLRCLATRRSPDGRRAAGASPWTRSPGGEEVLTMGGDVLDGAAAADREERQWAGNRTGALFFWGGGVAQSEIRRGLVGGFKC